MLTIKRSIARFSRLSRELYYNDRSDPNESKFNKILIANRGEIACRIIETCNRMGIRTVAVHTEIDAFSRFVKLADESVCIGSSSSHSSYASMNKIVNAVIETGADAVHPGYGFLSENAAFVERLEKLNVTFIGPNSKSIRLIGDKISSKRIAALANVNCVPGYDDEVDSPEMALQIAKKIGYPVIVKASSGAGGKGMRISWNDNELLESYRISCEEAVANFGNDRMLIEKYIDKPRHIEVQVICDKHGNAVHLNERECSIQRRYQKIIEEAPSLLIDQKTRSDMGKQATQLALTVGYDSAGTVEFLVDAQDNFYFLEMNTRLQVEHMISECITGIDIVRQMIRIAKGHRLLHTQTEIPLDGWALECRIYAEDVGKEFGLPCTGRILSYTEPVRTSGLVCSSGITEGSQITTHYDHLISKLIAYGDSRADVLALMITALDNYIIRGVKNNIPLLRDILTEKRFVSGDVSTNYLPETYLSGFNGKVLTESEICNLAALGAIIHLKMSFRDRFDVCYKFENLNPEMHPVNLVVKIENTNLAPIKTVIHVDVNPSQKSQNQKFFSVQLSPWQTPLNANNLPKNHNLKRDKKIAVNKEALVRVEDNFTLNDVLIEQTMDGVKFVFQLTSKNHLGDVCLQYLGTLFSLKIREEKFAFYESAYMLPKARVAEYSSMILSPMPGLLTSIAVKVGDCVSKGQEICLLEAMKMQNSLIAGRSGIIKSVNFKKGQRVASNDVIAELE